MTVKTDDLDSKLKKLESLILAGEIDEIEEVLKSINYKDLNKAQSFLVGKLEIQYCLSKGDFEAGQRRLASMKKKHKFKQGSSEWIENLLLRSFIHQSLGHSSKAEKDILTILDNITPESVYYYKTLFNLATSKKNKGLFNDAQELYEEICNAKDTSPELVTRAGLASAAMMSDLNRDIPSFLHKRIADMAPRWGGWKELKTFEILSSLQKFRMGSYGAGRRELFIHVKEADESDFVLPRLRARMALIEVLIQTGDFRGTERLLTEISQILTAVQHSSLKHLQPFIELLWAKIEVAENSSKMQLLEVLDRLEIILAVVAKYPRPPGPCPFWQVIAMTQEKLLQIDQAIRSYEKAKQEAANNDMFELAAEAAFRLSCLKWNQLSEEQRNNSSSRNMLLMETSSALELLSQVDRPEIQWKVHYLRGRIFKESGEQYPSKEEFKTAAAILCRLLQSIDDPVMRKTYRQTDDRLIAIEELEEYFNTEEKSLVQDSQSKTVHEKTDSHIVFKQSDSIEAGKLQDVLNALNDIHAADSISNLVETLSGWSLQVLNSDRAKIILMDSPGEKDQHFQYRNSKHRNETFLIPDEWLKETAKTDGVFTFTRSADENNYETRYAIVSTLKEGNRIKAYLYIDRLKRDGLFSDGEKQIIQTLIGVASVAFSTLSMRSRLNELNKQFQREIVPEFAHIIGESTAIKDVFIQMQRVAPAEVPVLIHGDTGTGKDLIARTIHEISHRKDFPLVYLDCSSIPETLLESELFGIADGIATGVESRIGLLEYANGGTILLDEVADIPLSIQAKLLRVLQEREFEPVGSDRVVQVDIRIISTTSQNLKQLISDGKMREDFYYRLSGVVIDLPPLHQRPGDVLLMARTFLQKYNRDFKKKIKGFSSELLDAMMDYHWPGNVRELDHRVRKAVLFCKDELLDLPEMDLSVVKSNHLTLKQAVDSLKMTTVKNALKESGNDFSLTAEILGISETRLNKLIQELDLTNSESENG